MQSCNDWDIASRLSNLCLPDIIVHGEISSSSIFTHQNTGGGEGLGTTAVKNTQELQSSGCMHMP